MRAGSFASRDLARARHISRVRLGAGVSSSTVAVIALTAAAVGLRFYRLGHQGFWYDEANSALLVRMSPGRMLGLLGQSESTPPLYYCLAWVWVRVFGSGEAGLRSLSALAGVAVVPVAYGIGAVLATRRVGLVAAALAASNTLLIWYSQEARSYSLLVLLSAVSLLAFAWLARAPSRRWLIAWGGGVGVSFVYPLLRHRRRRPAGPMALVRAAPLAVAPRHLDCRRGSGRGRGCADPACLEPECQRARSLDRPHPARSPAGTTRTAVPARTRLARADAAGRGRHRAGPRRGRARDMPHRRGRARNRTSRRRAGGRRTGPHFVSDRFRNRRPHHPQCDRPVGAGRPRRQRWAGRPAGRLAWARPGRPALWRRHFRGRGGGQRWLPPAA